MAWEYEIPFFETEIVQKRVRKNISARSRVPRYHVNLVREGGIWVKEKTLSEPSAVYELAKEALGDTDREQMWVICLDVRNKAIGVNLISIGSLSMSVAHPREVLKVAILLNAASFIIFHNHPSGEAEPSGEDLNLTRRIQNASKIIGIQMLDHIIVGYDTYLSIFTNYSEFK